MSDLYTLATAAAKLIQMLGDQAEADAAAFRDAYRLGYEAGADVGRRQLDYELIEEDRRRTEYMSGITNSPAYAELEHRRWDGRRQDFGKPRLGDFPGVAASRQHDLWGAA